MRLVFDDFALFGTLQKCLVFAKNFGSFGLLADRLAYVWFAIYCVTHQLSQSINAASLVNKGLHNVDL